MTYRKKLIEVALPLDAINEESAREKSIRTGTLNPASLVGAPTPSSVPGGALRFAGGRPSNDLPEEGRRRARSTIRNPRGPGQVG